MERFEKLFLLDGLSSAEKKEIVSSFSDKRLFTKGTIIYSSVKFSKAIGYILSGSAYAVVNNNNKVIMKKFTSGMCFGAAAVFGSNKNYVSSVVANTDIEVLFITEEQLNKIFCDYPKTAINYITFLSDKIRFLNSKLSVISCSSAEDSVFKYLISVTDDSGYAQLPNSMTLFAQMLGLGRASLYRSLEALENDGLIIRENNKIKLVKN